MYKRKQPVRKRNIHLHFCVDEEERKLIQERKDLTGIISLGAFLRKMAIEGYHIYVDLSDVREMVSLLRRCTNSLNQIAKRVNETGSIYRADLEDLRQRYDTLWDSTNKILAGLAKIR